MGLKTGVAVGVGEGVAVAVTVGVSVGVDAEKAMVVNIKVNPITKMTKKIFLFINSLLFDPIARQPIWRSHSAPTPLLFPGLVSQDQRVW